jgi:hypothetical protein
VVRGAAQGTGSKFRSEFKVALDRLREGILRGTPWPGTLGERGVKRLLMQRPRSPQSGARGGEAHIRAIQPLPVV